MELTSNFWKAQPKGGVCFNLYLKLETSLDPRLPRSFQCTWEKRVSLDRDRLSLVSRLDITLVVDKIWPGYIYTFDMVLCVLGLYV